jgi:hypothetical protein
VSRRRTQPATLRNAPRRRLPGELAGYGTITAEQARELAAQGTWRRILTDPATGAPTDYSTTVYRPPAAPRDLVVTRTPIAEPIPQPPDPDEPPPF